MPDERNFRDKLAQFGSDARDKAEKLKRNAVDSSKKMAEKVKLQNTIRHAEAKLNEIYLAIGKKYEEIYGSKNAPEFVNFMVEIADVKAQIAAAKAELSNLDNASACPNCKKYVMEHQKFCPYCGTKLIESVDGVVIDSDSE
ncbi:MAG: zinc ribbon domain-containing protein [Oscillospiraceae bacterium]|nr:zinc ribbon domain-containing protein [Ruminococcus sp.]MDE6707625.1 zinc ribbon domain-containing protein [Oscillospiraceae bacterium]